MMSTNGFRQLHYEILNTFFALDNSTKKFDTFKWS